jgi:hypothetical protein
VIAITPSAPPYFFQVPIQFRASLERIRTSVRMQKADLPLFRQFQKGGSVRAGFQGGK